MAAPMAASIFDINLRARTAVLASLAVLATVLTIVPTAPAQTLHVLHNFTGPDGWSPDGALVRDRAGNFYGTTDAGGAIDRGTVFRLSRAGSGWILTTLYSFQGQADGCFPSAGVVFGPDGALYGTTYECGQYGHGTVFRVRPSPSPCRATLCPWEETVLHNFTDGADGGNPVGNVVFDQAGNLYGATPTGGYGLGLVYELSPSNGGWTERVLWDFTGFGGINPYSALIFDNAGNLYGTTYNGAGDYGGEVYELSPSGSGWTQQVLSPIEFMATATCGGVVMDARGNLFGASGCDDLGLPGGVYELTPSNGSWTFNVLYTVSGSQGPADTPTLDAAGNVYATSSGTGLYSYGQVLKLTPSDGGWIYTDLHDFTNGADGSYPPGSVLLDGNGNLYGTTLYGGTGPCTINTYTGCGVVWEITP